MVWGVVTGRGSRNRIMSDCHLYYDVLMCQTSFKQRLSYYFVHQNFKDMDEIAATTSTH